MNISEQTIKDAFNKHLQNGHYKLESVAAHILENFSSRNVPINRIQLNALIFYSYCYALYNGIDLLGIDEIQVSRSGVEFSVDGINQRLFDPISQTYLTPWLLVVSDNVWKVCKLDIPIEWFTIDPTAQDIVDTVVDSYNQYHYWDLSKKVKEDIEKIRLGYDRLASECGSILYTTHLQNAAYKLDPSWILGDEHFKSEYS